MKWFEIHLRTGLSVFPSAIAMLAFMVFLVPGAAHAQSCPYLSYTEFARFVMDSHMMVEMAASADPSSGILGTISNTLAREGAKAAVANTKAAVDACPDFTKAFLEKGLSPQSSDPVANLIGGLLTKELMKANPEMAAQVRRAQAWLRSIR